jgi:glycosyltransferase involved in cell wall biosynthesis
LHKPYRLIGKKIFQKANKIICVSEYEKNIVLKNFGVNLEKVVVIPNGIHWDEFKAVEKGKRTVNDKKSLIYVGRLEKYKGIDYLIKALQGIDANVSLEIVGSGPFQSDLVSLSKKLNVANRVNFYQNLSRRDVIEKYANATLAVSLSTHEAYALMVAEALASGTRCLVANSQALSEWIDNRDCVGVNYPIDIGELSRLINKLINEDKLVSSLSQQKILDWTEVVSQIQTQVYDLL